jgi:hypothetical protein
VSKRIRRAITIERRATRTAIQRARRETLYGRFIRHAGLLLHLASIRRPSKSAIINLSIAIMLEARRTRLIAARELRLIRAESDVLRRENNEWRARVGLPRLEEPARSTEFMGLINPQETERTGGNGSWETTESLGEMGEEDSRAYEMAAQEEDGMDGDEDDFVRMQPQPAATISTGAVPSDESSKGPMSAGPALNQNVVSQQQQRVQQQQQQVPSVPQMNFACASNSANSFDMPIHPGLASGTQATCEPSGHQHGVSRASPAHSDFQAQRSRALLDNRISWAC